jgi:pimeloyl-ACP methyl ester carboxylesterase
LLQRFAQESSHRELSNVPVLFWGHSAAGMMAQVFADRYPDRALAFVDYHTPLVGDAAGVMTKIPALFLAGGKDTASPAAAVETTWKSGRAMRAPWTFAVEPDAEHGDLTEKGYGLMVPWTEAVIRQRLPPNGTTLRPITDGSAWLGNNGTGEVAPYATFTGSKTKASWLPDEATARAWQTVLGVGK